MNQFQVTCEIQFVDSTKNFDKIYVIPTRSVKVAVKRAMELLDEEVGRRQLAYARVICQTVSTKYL